MTSGISSLPAAPLSCRNRSPTAPVISVNHERGALDGDLFAARPPLVEPATTAAVAPGSNLATPFDHSAGCASSSARSIVEGRPASPADSVTAGEPAEDSSTAFRQATENRCGQTAIHGMTRERTGERNAPNILQTRPIRIPLNIGFPILPQRHRRSTHRPINNLQSTIVNRHSTIPTRS